MDGFFKRKVETCFKIYTPKQQVYVQNLQGNVKLRIMTQDNIVNFLNEIPSKDQNLIKYVHL